MFILSLLCDSGCMSYENPTGKKHVIFARARTHHSIFVPVHAIVSLFGEMLYTPAKTPLGPGMVFNRHCKVYCYTDTQSPLSLRSYTFPCKPLSHAHKISQWATQQYISFLFLQFHGHLLNFSSFRLSIISTATLISVP